MPAGRQCSSHRICWPRSSRSPTGSVCSTVAALSSRPT
jgi:hypothetical protein